MTIPTPFAPLALLIALAAPAAAEGQRSGVRLLAGWAEGAGRVAGLEISLAPGWKTYWRAPGEAGLPPQFDWSGSTNLDAVAVEWPAPRVIHSFGMRSIVYDRDVILPLRLTPGDPAAPIGLRLTLDYGVCDDICIPVVADVALDIAAGAPPQDAARIAAHRARTPLSAAEGGVTGAECALRGAGALRDFSALLRFDRPPAEPPVAVVEGPENVWFAPAETTLDGAELRVTARAQVGRAAGWIGRDALRVTLIGPDGAVEIDGCAPPR